MTWGRAFHGHVSNGGLVHSTYENCKFDRIYWDTQCNIRWGHRENRIRKLMPKTTRKPVTCLVCLAEEWKVSGWIERTSTSRSAL